MTSTTTQTLFSELSLGDLKLKNRIALAPLTRARSGPERIPNERMVEYYTQRASAGLLITEATVISERGFGWVETPGIYNQAQVDGWKAVTDAVHAKGSKIILQLWHCGRASHSDFFDGQLPVSASAIKINGDQVHTPTGKKDYEVPRALTTEETEQTVADYVAAGQRAKEAGFDGVEVHGANGYLIDQFLQSKTNHRDDKYGGSVENRFRFLREIIEGVLTVFPANRVGVRLSPNGAFNDMGSEDYRETFDYAISEIAKYQLGYLHVMDGLGFGFHELGEAYTLEEIRKIYPGVLMGNCGYDKESATEQIQKGHADFISFGRPYLSNPDLVERFQNDWPLNPTADMKYWYSPGEAGYTDFPTYQEK